MPSPFLQIQETDRGTTVCLHGELEVARMYVISDAQGKRRLHLEVSDTGEATMDLVLAVFRYAKAMGGIPIMD
jgi:hypothetical protein